MSNVSLLEIKTTYQITTEEKVKDYWGEEFVPVKGEVTENHYTNDEGAPEKGIHVLLHNGQHDEGGDWHMLRVTPEFAANPPEIVSTLLDIHSQAVTDDA